MKKTTIISALMIAAFVIGLGVTVYAFAPSQSCTSGQFFNSVSSTGNYGCGTPAASGGSVTTSSAPTAFYFPYWTNTTGGLNGTSSLFTTSSTNDLTVASTSDNGLFSVVNASQTVAFAVATSTANANRFQVLSATGTSPYLGVTSSGLPLFLGTSTAVAIGGASLALDACTSTTTIVPFALNTSTDNVYGTNPIVPLNDSIFEWSSYISQTGASTSTVTTQVCTALAAGATPTSTKYLFFVGRISGM